MGQLCHTWGNWGTGITVLSLPRDIWVLLVRTMPRNCESPSCLFCTFSFMGEKPEKTIPLLGMRSLHPQPTSLPPPLCQEKRNSDCICSYLLMGKREISPKFVLLNSYLRGWNLKVMKKTSSLNLSFNLLTFFLLFFLQKRSQPWFEKLSSLLSTVGWTGGDFPSPESFPFNI